VQLARTPEEVYGTIGDEVAEAGYHVIVFTLGSEETGASPRAERPDLKLTGAVERSTKAQGEASADEPRSLILTHVSADSAALRVAEKLSGVPVQGFRVPLAPGGLFQRIITENESIFHRRTAERIASGMPRLGRGLVDRLVAILGMERAIYAPLRVSGEAHGLLAVLGTDLTEADVPAVTAFANQAAIALENARLLEDLSASGERMRELAHQVVSMQEEERLRLSQALHDEAGQTLTALKITLDLIGTDLPVESAALQHRLRDAAALTGDTMERIRLLAQDLRPPALDAVGLNYTLQGLCREFGARTGLSIDYHGQQVPRLPGRGNIALYRCLQEALTNAAKHAGANRVSVTLRYDAEKVRLSVEDDGQGFDHLAALPTPGGPKGIGLLGMQERLESLGGRLEIDSQPGAGACLAAEIPLDQA
jgi:signal transduction histidine kinase